MSDNLKYGIFLAVMVIGVLSFVAYISSRQSECEKSGGTLVRVPVGIGWNCVKTVGVR